MDKALEKAVHELKIDLLRMFYRSGTGHLASALSCIELLAVLYLDIKQPKDRVILSKGHGAAALYVVLARLGYIEREELATFYGCDSRLLALASISVPGIDIPTGSLGQGVCFAAGVAKVFQMDRKINMVYCVLGDGEMQEGSVWEMAMFAANQRLGNLVVILDHNRIQASGRIRDIAPVDPIRAKWEAFGWRVEEIDGHDMEKIHDTLQQNREQQLKQPLFIIANTIKGHGISFIADTSDCHMRNPKNDEWLQVCKEFQITMKELKQL